MTFSWTQFSISKALRKRFSLRNTCFPVRGIGVPENDEQIEAKEETLPGELERIIAEKVKESYKEMAEPVLKEFRRRLDDFEESKEVCLEFITLRIDGLTREAGFDEIRSILKFKEDEYPIQDVSINDAERFVLEFHHGDKLSAEETLEWEADRFRLATLWLRERSPDQFNELREAGLHPDIGIGLPRGYLSIPLPLIKEAARLDLRIMVVLLPQSED